MVRLVSPRLILMLAVLVPVPDGAAQTTQTAGERGTPGTIHNVTRGTIHATIQEAINEAATYGDEIEVGPGTYLERIDLLGKAITLRATDGPEATIIDGGSGGSVITCNSHEQWKTWIDGFTITGGSGTLLPPPSGITVGGGMYIDDSAPKITNCIFTGNTAGEGGGLYVDFYADPTLTDCSISGNTADMGGGLYSGYSSSPALIKSTLSGNEADYGGAIYEGGFASTALENSTVMGNTARISGGGIYNSSGGGAAVVNCIFSGNRALGEFSDGGLGGGMYHHDASNPRLISSTFSGNYAAVAGGGVYNESGNHPIVSNSILWGNIAPSHPNMTDGWVDANYSCIGGLDISWGTGNLNINPFFVDADGADDVFGTPDDDLRLSPGSPCEDTGHNDYLLPDFFDLDQDGDDVEPLPIDLDGHARVLCGAVDMGAYEFGIGDYECDDDVDLDDFAAWESCMMGPNVGGGCLCCAAFDFAFDDDVDLYDFARLQQGFTHKP